MYKFSDNSDKAILNILQRNAKCSLKSISEEVFLSIPTIRERIKNLEKQGYIKDYVAIYWHDLSQIH